MFLERRKIIWSLSGPFISKRTWTLPPGPVRGLWACWGGPFDVDFGFWLCTLTMSRRRRAIGRAKPRYWDMHPCSCWRWLHPIIIHRHHHCCCGGAGGGYSSDHRYHWKNTHRTMQQYLMHHLALLHHCIMQHCHYRNASHTIEIQALLVVVHQHLHPYSNSIKL